MKQFQIEWKILDADCVALVFSKATWGVFQSTADARGVDTCDMITEALVALLGTVVARPTKD
jgi:hypothetical protein